MLRSWNRVCAVAAVAGMVASTPALADAIDDEVVARAAATLSTMCFDQGPPQFERFDLTYPGQTGLPNDPPETMRLYRIFCMSGAYNAVHVFFSHREAEGIQQVFFTVPDYTVNCAGGTTVQDNCQLTGIDVTGMRSVGSLVNSTFNAKTGSLTSASCWRGVCDASDQGVWEFRDGYFALVTFDVDPTYDGQQNAVRIVDFPA